MVADNLQKLTVNLAARVRSEVLNGRRYLVAPASLIVPGVLNGSDGALYYPPEEAVKNASAWDGMPLVVYHPLRNGMPVAAQDPDHRDWVWRESGIGHLRNSKANGKLTSEAWFDEELTRNYDKRLPSHVQILPRLLSNTPIELSTGLYVDRDETPGTCPKSGRPYDAVARNYRPDHLAILPDQRGACSVQDGCGVVMNSNPEGINQYTKGGGGNKFPDVDTEKMAAEGKSRMDAMAKEFGHKVPEGKHDTVAGAAHTLLASIASMPQTDVPRLHWAKSLVKMLTGNAGKYGNPQHGDTGKYQPHGSGMGKGANHAAAVEGHKPVKEGMASEAEEDGTKQGGETLEDNCSTGMPMTTKNADGWVTLPNGVHVEIKGGEIVKGPSIGKPGPAHVSASDKAKVASDKAGKSGSKSDHLAAAKTHSEAAKTQGDMGKKALHYQAAQHHEYAASKAKDDAEMVQLLPDRPRNPGLEKLAASKKSTKNQSRGQDDPALVTNEENAMAVATKLPESERLGLVEKIVANCKCTGDVADARVLNKLSDATLMRLNAMADQADESPVESPVEEDERSPKKKLPPQFAKNMSAKEWLDAAPPEIQSAVTNAMRVERSARQGLISKLVANTAKESKEKYEKFLSNKSLDELETLVEMMPTPTVNRSDDMFDSKGNVAPVFLGAAGGFEGGRQPAPTFNTEADPEMDPQYAARQLAKV